MATYTIIQTTEGPSVLCDNKPITMKVFSDLADPRYSVGDRSDGTRNLAYSVLAHWKDEDTADVFHEDFMSTYLLDESRLPIRITDFEITQFVTQTGSAYLQARKVIDQSTDI